MTKSILILTTIVKSLCTPCVRNYCVSNFSAAYLIRSTNIREVTILDFLICHFENLKKNRLGTLRFLEKNKGFTTTFEQKRLSLNEEHNYRSGMDM